MKRTSQVYFDPHVCHNTGMFYYLMALNMVLAAPPTKVLTAASLVENSKPSDWRPLNVENTLYMDLPSGRVIIELDPDFAPKHVANVKELASEKYWDGLAVVRVQDNYVAQWADPNVEKPELKRKVKSAQEHVTDAELDVALNRNIPFQPLPDKDVYAAETGFSNGFAAGRDPKAKRMWLLHCYGAVGVGRDNAADSGNGAELYAVIGQSPRHLDRNVTVIGRIVQGAELLSSMPRGHGQMGFFEKPDQNIPIRAIKPASEVPEKERANLEVLRTDTPLFKQWVEARRNRREEWFKFAAGHIDACNLSVPIRERKSELKVRN